MHISTLWTDWDVVEGVMVRVALITFAVAFVAVTHATARQVVDVVYLENGGIVRGTILEQIPDGSLKIRWRDG